MFIALAASVTESEMAIAGTGLYTSGSIGSVIGISISVAIFKLWAKKGLERTLQSVENGIKVSGTEKAAQFIGIKNFRSHNAPCQMWATLTISVDAFIGWSLMDISMASERHFVRHHFTFAIGS